MLFPDQLIHGVSLDVLLCIFFAAVLAPKNSISCGFSFDESKLFFTYAHDVSQSIITHSLIIYSFIL